MSYYKNRKQQGQQYQQLQHRCNFTKLDSNNKFSSNKIIDDKKFQYNCHSSTGFYEDTHKYSTDCNECEHQAKINKLKQKLKRLEFQQLQLQKENDHIMRSIENSSLRTKNAEKNAEVWKNKYEKLKAQNDRKAIKLAYAPSPLSISPLSNQLPNKNEQKALSTKRRQSSSTKQLKNSQKYQVNHVKSRQQIFTLTKQQKQYVRHLQSQQQKRRRTNSNVASMKNLHPYDPNNDGQRHRESQFGERTQRKYSARLDDGLVIHIIDERGKEKERQRARSYRK